MRGWFWPEPAAGLVIHSAAAADPYQPVAVSPLPSVRKADDLIVHYIRPEPDHVSARPENVLVYMPVTELVARNSVIHDGARTGFFAFLDRAECGSTDAQAVVALMHLIGWVDNEIQVDNAEYWAAKSAAAGNAYGQWVLAWAKLEKSDYQEGLDSLIKSAEQGFAPAISYLADFALNGVIVPMDRDLAIELAATGASLGHEYGRALTAELDKRGYSGFLRMIYSILFFPLVNKFRGLSYLIRLKTYDLNRLSYARALVVENEIRRKLKGETVDSKYEKQLYDFLPTTRRKSR